MYSGQADNAPAVSCGSDRSGSPAHQGFVPLLKRHQVPERPVVVLRVHGGQTLQPRLEFSDLAAHRQIFHLGKYGLGVPRVRFPILAWRLDRFHSQSGDELPGPVIGSSINQSRGPIPGRFGAGYSPAARDDLADCAMNRNGEALGWQRIEYRTAQRGPLDSELEGLAFQVDHRFARVVRRWLVAQRR